MTKTKHIHIHIHQLMGEAKVCPRCMQEKEDFAKKLAESVNKIIEVNA